MQTFKQLWKYVDLTSFASMMPGGRSWLGRAIFLGCACSAALFLVRMWWKGAGVAKPASTLVWATTLTWTLVLSVYVPIYDSILIVLSVIATMAALKDVPGKPFYGRFTLVWLLIFACSWITVDLAEKRGFQLITLSFAALGIVQFAAFQKMTLRRPAPAAGIATESQR